MKCMCVCVYSDGSRWGSWSGGNNLLHCVFRSHKLCFVNSSLYILVFRKSCVVTLDNMESGSRTLLPVRPDKTWESHLLRLNRLWEPACPHQISPYFLLFQTCILPAPEIYVHIYIWENERYRERNRESYTHFLEFRKAMIVLEES